MAHIPHQFVGRLFPAVAAAIVLIAASTATAAPSRGHDRGGHYRGGRIVVRFDAPRGHYRHHRIHRRACCDCFRDYGYRRGPYHHGRRGHFRPHRFIDRDYRGHHDRRGHRGRRR